MNFSKAAPYIYYGYLLLTCGYAIIRGNRSEYAGAAIIVTASVVGTTLFIIFGTAWTGVSSSTFYVDIALLLALIVLTIVSDRFWPIWATAFHLVAVSVHIATMVAPDLAPWALATGTAFWAYPMLLAMAVGSHEYVRPVEAEPQQSG